MDDREAQMLVENVLNGDPESFAPLVRGYTPPLYNLAFKMTGGAEPAAEAVQETFFRAYRDLGKYDGRARVLAWLYGICVNVCYDAGKRRKRSFEREQPIEDAAEASLVSVQPSAEEALASRQEEGWLRGCLGRLPESLRAAVLLRYQEELPVGEVAAQLRIGVSAAKMRIQRGIEMLRALCAEAPRGGTP
jgi:RNA polymerase sigma-70 factor (ECF subfamily)